MTGILSAGHCNSYLDHSNGIGLIRYPMTPRGEHQGAWGDFGWYTTTQPEPPLFYYNFGVLADVTGRGVPKVGQVICRFGYTSGKKCDTVDETSRCYDPDDGPQRCKVVMMNHGYGQDGDSGGPWYVGTVAYGVHSGWMGCGFLWGAHCDVWSLAIHTDEALGLAILQK